MLIIDDEADVHYSFKRLFADKDISIFTAGNGEDGLKLVQKHKPDVVVMDIRMGKESGLQVLQQIRHVNPKQIVIMMTAYGTSQTAIEAMKLGAFDYVLKPFNIPELKQLISRAFEASRYLRQTVNLSTPNDAELFRSGLIGQSVAMQKVYKLIGQVAPTDATVLIQGESGTGKELVARAIFANSKRADQLFIAINCAAIPENLLESELFGHEKGSFTGATQQRVGKFEQCNGGTLFLDEIGEMPLSLQAKILRVLQDGEFFRVGGNTPLKTTARIIAATNRDLKRAVKDKKFREDLYYRLNVFHITIPPLRDRVEDLPLLVNYFTNKWKSKKQSHGIKVSEQVLKQFQNHNWPGNVRELENLIQRALVLANGDTVTLRDIEAEFLQHAGTTPATMGMEKKENTESKSIDRVKSAMQSLIEHAQHQKEFKLLPSVERELIIYVLEHVQGNQVQAAKLLGITRATLRKRIERFGLMKEVKVNPTG
jgi:two-component system nitrogen regulation response regulator GlnG